MGTYKETTVTLNAGGAAMFCPKCNASLTKPTRFCPYCSALLDDPVKVWPRYEQTPEYKRLMKACKWPRFSFLHGKARTAAKVAVGLPVFSVLMVIAIKFFWPLTEMDVTACLLLCGTLFLTVAVVGWIFREGHLL